MHSWQHQRQEHVRNVNCIIVSRPRESPSLPRSLQERQCGVLITQRRAMLHEFSNGYRLGPMLCYRSRVKAERGTVRLGSRSCTGTPTSNLANQRFDSWPWLTAAAASITRAAPGCPDARTWQNPATADQRGEVRSNEPPVTEAACGGRPSSSSGSTKGCHL